MREGSFHRTKMLVYLCGAIEYSPDHGKAWRAEITPFLKSLGHEVYDPALDERRRTSQRRRGSATFANGRAPIFRDSRGRRKMIDYDLDWIERKCDYIVAYWDEFAGRGAGFARRTDGCLQARRPDLFRERGSDGAGERLDFGCGSRSLP